MNRYVSIFGSKAQSRMFAVRYDGEVHDEWTKCVLRWRSPSFLLEELRRKKNLLSYHGLQLSDAVVKTRDLAEDLLRKVYEKRNDVDEVFEPLRPGSPSNRVLVQMKSDKRDRLGEPVRTWLRVYAIRIDDGIYLVTGSALKNSRRAEDDTDTMKEIHKLQRMRLELIERGVFDAETFLDYL